MIEISELRVVQPHEVEPGTLLLGGAHYSDPPMFIFAWGEERFRFDVGGKDGFVGRQMAVNLHPYVLGGAPTVIVDVDTKISPTRSDIPTGAMVLIGERACFAITLNHGTFYVGVDGQMIENPRSYDRFVALPRWQLVVPAFGQDKWKVVYEATGEAGG